MVCTPWPRRVLCRVQLFVTPWTVAHQASLSLGFFRQEYWSGLPFSTPGDLPNPGIKPMSPALQPTCPAWQVDSLPLRHPESLLDVQNQVKPRWQDCGSPIEGLKGEQRLRDRGNRRRGRELRKSRWPGSLHDCTEIT